MAVRIEARVRHAFVTLLALSPVLASACVVRLNEKNSPEEGGDVSGPPADCATITPLATGAPGTGAAHPRLVGRYDLSEQGHAWFDWSGNYITARFTGSRVSVGIELGQDSQLIFEAVVDDREPIKITVDPGQTMYPIATDLGPGEHEVMVMRNSEALFGLSSFTGFDIGDGAFLPPTDHPRRIEFIGDSITCGYGIEGPNATCPYDVEVRPGVRVPLTENVYRAFGSQTARALSAEATTICYSGKGVVLNYREPPDDVDAKTTLPMYWERTVATREDSPRWDFAKEAEPSVVVVSLGTNDYTRDMDQDTIADGLDVEAFKRGYTEFLRVVRQRRPNAHIFVTISPMLSDTFPFEGARKNMRETYGQIVSDLNAAGDAKIYRLEMVEMGTRYGLGCDYHPNLEVHRIMAEQLTSAIRSKTCW